MTKASFTVAYDGPALRDGVMDVRDLAPALLAIGELFEAANQALNGENARLSVKVRATRTGSFEIDLEILQTLGQQLVAMFSGDGATAALNLKELVLGGAVGLVWLIKKLKGRTPSRVERLDPDRVRIVSGDTVIEIPFALLRLYQDLAVRAAAQKAIEQPLGRDGIDRFEVRDEGKPVISVNREEAPYFREPEVPDEKLLEDTRRAAFSIVSLAFKEDNKWRLHDGANQISALIADEAFLDRVNANQVAFAKGDVLICEVKVTQARTRDGLKTDYVVTKVTEHRPAARQLPLQLGSVAPADPRGDDSSGEDAPTGIDPAAGSS